MFMETLMLMVQVNLGIQLIAGVIELMILVQTGLALF